MSAAVGASSCTAAIAACSWYGPTGRAPSVRVTSAMPSAISAGVPAGPVLLGQRHEQPVGVGAGGPPGLGEQHQREQPGDLAVVRARSACSSRVSRIASRGQVGPLRLRPELVVYPSLNTR